MKMLMLKSVNGSWDLPLDDDSTGKELSDVTMKLLEKNKLELKHCTDEGHDNGANMKVYNSSVQKRNFRSKSIGFFFMPCGCHNMNLVLCGKIICEICRYLVSLGDFILCLLPQLTVGIS
jgi:hypothetical protein